MGQCAGAVCDHPACSLYGEIWLSFSVLNAVEGVSLPRLMEILCS